MTTKQKIVDRLNENIKNLQAQLKVILEQPDLEKLELNASLIGTNRIDFDNLSHEDVIKVIQVIGGKWDKRPGDNANVHYETKKNGITYYCYNGAPPPNCKIVEVLEEIPAQPARMVTKRKLVCQ